MSEQRIEDAFQNVAGEVHDAAGSVIGDTTSQIEGKASKAAGKARDVYNNAADQARGAAAEVGRLVDEQPFTALAVIGGLAFLVGWLAHRR